MLTRYLRHDFVVLWSWLPQLFHMLAGEMSLLGPRPRLASEVRRYRLIDL
jgi:hypothetical protein